MNQQFFHLLNFVLVSRLVYVFEDAPISRRRFLAMVLIQVVGLLSFEISITWGVLLVLMIGQAILFQRYETRSGGSEGNRSFSLLITIVLLSVFFSPALCIPFNPAPFGAIDRLGEYTILLLPFRAIRWEHAGVVVMGFLLVLNEANLFLRSQLRRLNLAPRHNENAEEANDGLSEGEYNTGRIIGMLERAIIFVAVLNNEVTAIGLVLAAKAFTRFKEFESRRFAEYVLIGTLLSAFIAVFVAMIVRGIVGG